MIYLTGMVLIASDHLAGLCVEFGVKNTLMDG